MLEFLEVERRDFLPQIDITVQGSLLALSAPFLGI